MDQYDVKGKRLESMVGETLEEIFRESSFEVLKGAEIIGCSESVWRPDFSVVKKSSGQFVIIIECKGIGIPKSWQYHAQICDAYMELSDLHLSDEYSSAKYYLIVNRPKEKTDAKTSRKDYKKLFSQIGVRLYHWTELEAEAWEPFVDELMQLKK